LTFDFYTDRLHLRQVLPDDQAFIFEGLSHPQVIAYYGIRYESFEATGAQMQWYAAIRKEGTGLSWIITDKINGTSMGDISVYRYCAEHNKAEIGFWLLPQYWHKGYALEALRAVMEFWANEKDLHRMEAFVEPENEASCRLLEKAGFAREGLMRDCEIKNGRYISLVVYARISKKVKSKK
jgi:[ribosomal protein S5]-alanine N-acetyltransferase